MSETNFERSHQASQNTAIVQQVVDEIWNRGNLELADTLFADEYINHHGLISDLTTGAEAIKVSVALYLTAFPNLHVTAHDLICQGETVAVRWTARNRGPADSTPQGSETTSGTLTGMTFCRVVDGKITESWTSWDTATVVRELGVSPS